MGFILGSEMKVRAGDIEVYKGTKKYGFLKVAGTPPANFKIPVVVVNGEKEGPTLGIIAGIHGCEYSGMEAVIRICNELDPAKLHGVIIAIPVANVPAFQSRTPHVCPIDNVDLMNAFPGNMEGSIGYRIAYTLFNEVILKSDYLIDIHGGDLHEELMPSGYVICSESKNEEINKKSEMLASLFDTEYIWILKFKGSCTDVAIEQGMPAIIPEAGGVGAKMDENAIKFYTDGLLNVMKYLKMIQGIPRIKAGQKKVYGMTLVKSSSWGFFHPRVRAGKQVSENEVLGETRDLLGKKVEEVLSPIDGIVMLSTTHTAVNPEDFLMVIATFA